MNRLAEKLLRSAVMRDADPQAVAEMSTLWSGRTLAPGEILWYEGQAADALALVLEGALAIDVAGHAVSTVMPGELVGEAGAFIAGERAQEGKRPRAPAAVSPSVMARSAEYERLRWFELPA